MKGLLVAVLGAAAVAQAAELKQNTVTAFGTYVRANESRMEARRAQGRFLWWQGRAEIDRAALRGGTAYIERLNACDKGQPIPIPGGMVHHWIGVVFIPGATVDGVLRVLQDYDNHKRIYPPEVIDSRLVSREGDRYVSYLRVLKKKVLTAVLDATYDNTYKRISPTRVTLRSHSLSIQEIEGYGKPGERKLPPGNDRGFLWRMYSYWSIEQTDGGTYAECESVSLSRDIPSGLSAIIRPFLDNVPRESLCSTLTSTRQAVQPGSAGGARNCTLAAPAGQGGECQ